MLLNHKYKRVEYNKTGLTQKNFIRRLMIAHKVR